MTHTAYLASSYGLALAVLAGLAVSARVRLRSVRRRLAALDPRERAS